MDRYDNFMYGFLLGQSYLSDLPFNIIFVLMNYNIHADVQFLKQAVEQVIECRQILKYTYVLGHYLKDNTSEKELYEHHQVTKQIDCRSWLSHY